MQLKSLHRIRLLHRLKPLLIVLFYFFISTAFASNNETLSSGAFIIDMGVTPQTNNNGLKPYGMLYDLITNYGIEVKWIINDTKSKDGTDFTYNSTNYKGGPFIIRAEDITSTITSRITYWTGQGVQGTYTTSSITVPVYTTLSYFPKAMIDNTAGKQNVIEAYYTNAGISSSAYTEGTPADLSTCIDIWANPHGDPTWTTHSYLYNYVTVNKSYIWSQCHAVSVLEGTSNPSSPYQQLNFLTASGLKCYSSGKCGSASETHTSSSTSPYTYYYPTDPVMQFMSTMDGATKNGSEQWYIPLSTSSWLSSAKRLVTSSDGSSPNEGVLMVYGPAYGNSSNGYVMYEGGHDLNGAGTSTEKVAAQRAFFNFVLLAGLGKQPLTTTYSMPSYMWPNQQSNVSVTPSGGCTPYTYSWSSNFGGSFANASAASTIFYSPSYYTSGVLKCTITDCCGRQRIVSVILTVSNSALPLSLSSFTASQKDNGVRLNWTTHTEANNDYFTISRSSDNYNYTELTRIPGNGTSSEIHNYAWLDKNPQEGDNYYSLSQTDYDGTVKTLPTVYIKVTLTKPVFSLSRAGPIPFSSYLHINYTLPDSGSVDFILLNSSGQVMRRQQVLSAGGENEFAFSDLAGLPKGLYFLMLRNEEGEMKRMNTLKE